MSSSIISKELEEYVIAMRRHFHQHPELSTQEVNTEARICEELDKMGLPYVRVPVHNVIACLEGAPGGKTLAIRGDIDALPVMEEGDLPFRSSVDGVAHACGHDAHTAILLGTCKYLAEHHDGLQGKIYFCFQCAEEIPDHGANDVVPYLESIGGADMALGLHTWDELKTGEISIESGPRSSGSCFFDVTVLGRGSHGSRPDLGIDPIRPACDMIQQLSSIPSNQHYAQDPLLINVGQIHAGSANNIVPPTATFSGTIRFFTRGMEKTMEKLFHRFVEGTAAAYGAGSDIKIIHNTNPIINSEEATAIAEIAVSKIDGLSAAKHDADMGSDDYYMYTDAFTGIYAYLGIDDGVTPAYPQHHPKYHVDEASLKYGVEFFIRFAQEYLKF